MRDIAIVAVLVVAAGCASAGAGAPMAVEMTHPAGPGTATLDFAATGAAVDDGAVCPTGAERIVEMEDTAGQPITDAQWGEQFDAAMAEGSVAELVARSEWVCDDGSGTFTVELRNRYDFETFAFEGQRDIGTWSVVEGTDAHTGIGGSGDLTIDFDTQTVTYAGEVTAP